MLKKALLENKFALANFILLNEVYCEVSTSDLHVIQIVEQYQNEYNQAIDFQKLEKLISMDINNFKMTLNLLITRKLIQTKIITVGDLNTLQYDTNNFWYHIASKFMQRDYSLNLKTKEEELNSYIIKKFNKNLTTTDTQKLASTLEFYDVNILKEIVDQCVSQEATQIDTFISFVKMYKDANCQDLIEIQTTYNTLGM